MPSRKRPYSHEDADEERAEKRKRRTEKQKRKELRRLRRAARATLPNHKSKTKTGNTEVNTSSGDYDGEEREQDERNLAESGIFVWKKKNEELRKRGIRLNTEDELKRKMDIQQELERSKMHRSQRELERSERERTQAQHAREREQAENEDWHRSEHAFVGKQHLLRQAIRLRQGRGTDIDELARNMRLDLLDVRPDARSPAEYLDDRVRQGLTANQVEELAEKVENELDCLPDYPAEMDTLVFSHTNRLQWWTCIEQFLKTLARSLRERGALIGPSTLGVHSSVQRDVDNLLRGKTRVELEILERTLSDRLAGHHNGDSADEAIFGEVDFWAAAIRSIRSQLARVDLSDLTRKFAVERQCLVSAGQGKNQPANIDNKNNGKKSSEEMMKAEEAKGMGENEQVFADEAVLPSRREAHKDTKRKHGDSGRTRKPRYFNRVHTGYDWTKYNRTHYDQNNPPPKTVQGYKFNIFYSDLAEKSVTPSFSISKTDNPDVCIIRFTAGPPYEDIAFKIINRPWEQSHRKGFKCDFERGVLRLWFTFQRYRYRR